MAKAPKEILEIRQSNPAPPSGFADAGAATIALGRNQPTPVIGGNFPSVDARQEWKQVLAPDEDYEVNLVGACGWVLGPRFSGGDLPFDHPFDVDWEFMLAVDDDPSYTSLLARGNQVPEEDPNIVNRARDLQIPVPAGSDGAPSLLGVEIDGGLVPKAFSDGAHVAEGDRMAVFGRWIVDCGHAVSVPVPNPGDPTYRSEIHPPLLMASARVAQGTIATGSPVGPQVTRVLFTSRPYLVGQHFTTNPDHAYDDADPADDGTFVDHMVHEFKNVNDTFLGIPTSSTFVEAHPKIKSTPYAGAFVAHLVVRAPTAQPAQGGGVVHPTHGHPGQSGVSHVPGAGAGAAQAQKLKVPPIEDPLRPHLSVSFQFTVRTGCAVEVIQTEPDTAEVFITFGHAPFSPPLPPRRERTWSKDELAAINSEATAAFLGVELISGLIQAISPLHGSVVGAAVVEEILSRGIKTDEYDTGPLRNINTLDASHVVATGTNGVVTDDNQPYPVFGWLELSWMSPQIVS